jgi:hypothetical protein
MWNLTSSDNGSRRLRRSTRVQADVKATLLLQEARSGREVAAERFEGGLVI